MVKKVVIITATCLVLLSLSGCDSSIPTPSDDSQEQYNMAYSVDAPQYCMFVNKQLTAVSNELSSTMIIAKSVSNGEYPKSDALTTIQQSLSIISSAKAEIEVMCPPEQYKDTRENTLRLCTNAENDLSTLCDYLTNDANNSKIKDLFSIMQTDFTALLTEFNIYYDGGIN